MHDTVHTRALVINVVNANKPKMLRGLSPKALSGEQGFPRTLAWPYTPPGGKSAPHPCLSTVWNVGSPSRPLREQGRQAARSTEGAAGRGVGKSAGRPGMGRIRVAPSPDAHAGRLPCGVDGRANLTNRSRGRGKGWRHILLGLSPTPPRTGMPCRGLPSPRPCVGCTHVA